MIDGLEGLGMCAFELLWDLWQPLSPDIARNVLVLVMVGPYSENVRSGADLIRLDNRICEDVVFV